MSNLISDVPIQTQLHEIKQKQEAILLITKSHLEMYSRQITLTNEMNNNLVELQKRSYQSQMIVMTIAVMIALGAAMYILLV
jgi:hypothetical protein